MGLMYGAENLELSEPIVFPDVLQPIAEHLETWAHLIYSIYLLGPEDREQVPQIAQRYLAALEAHPEIGEIRELFEISESLSSGFRVEHLQDAVQSEELDEMSAACIETCREVRRVCGFDE